MWVKMKIICLKIQLFIDNYFNTIPYFNNGFYYIYN